MPSGASTFSVMYCAKVWPETASTALPAQSIEMPYSHFSPGSNTSGVRQRGVLAGDDAGDAGRLHVAAHVGVPDVVGEASGVGQQVAQGDGAPGRPQARLAVGIEALQHLHAAEFRQDRGDIAIQRQLPSAPQAASRRRQ